MFKTVSASLLTLAIALVPAARREAVDNEMNARIRKEGREHSHILRTVHYLTDVYGPRLTGSPNHKAAAEWAIKQMTEWGLENGHLEPWDFGHPGWLNERFSGFIVSPVKDSLVGEVLAWTPSTKGTVTAEAVHVIPPTGPTQEELTRWIAETTPKVKGRIVLVGRHTIVPVTFTKAPLRRDDADLKRQYQADGARRTAAGPARQRTAGTAARPPQRHRRRRTDRRDARLGGGAGAPERRGPRSRPDSRLQQPHVRRRQGRCPRSCCATKTTAASRGCSPTSTPVRLEFTIVNRSYPEGRTSYNTIAEIPGTDKKDEVVMLGGHLDSWHSATGATDNAIGCAVMMEAARILKALGVQPRRTIRVALWSGEEQGLLGSKAYVKEHFGTYENPKPEYATFAGYFNVDSGTGRIRGASVFGPKAAADVLREALRAVRGLRRDGRLDHAQPPHRRHRQHLVQRGGTPGHRPEPGSDRVRQLHVAHQPRHLRTHCRGRRAEVGDRGGRRGLSPGHA